MAYPYDIGDIPITGRIGITGLADTYATFIDVLGQGGHQSIETVADRDIIPTARRKFGMLTTVYLDGAPANNATYILANVALGGTTNTITDNSNWIQFTGGGISTTLASGDIIVGSAGNVATAVTMSGDATIIASGSLTIANNSVSYGKMQAMTTNRLLGSGAGTAVSEITLGTGLSYTGSTLNVTSSTLALTATQIAYGSAGNTMTSDANLIWNASPKELRINNTTVGTEAIVIGTGNIYLGNGTVEVTRSGSAAGNFTGNASNVAAFFITSNNINTAGISTLDVRDNSSNTAIRPVIEATVTNTAAVNTTPFSAYNVAPTSTNYFRQIKLTAVGAGTTVNTLWQGNGTTPDAVLTGTAGDVLYNGLSNLPEYSLGGTIWRSVQPRVRVITAAGAVTVVKSDAIVVVNKTVPAATVVNLPAAPAIGDTYVIKDGSGTATAFNLTVTPAAGTIDGAATYVIIVNYNANTFLYNGTEWNVI